MQAHAVGHIQGAFQAQRASAPGDGVGLAIVIEGGALRDRHLQQAPRCSSRPDHDVILLDILGDFDYRTGEVDHAEAYAFVMLLMRRRPFASQRPSL